MANETSTAADDLIQVCVCVLCSQVTEETAQLAQTLGYSITLRGVVNVKGKGQLTTYFIIPEHPASDHSIDAERF